MELLPDMLMHTVELQVSLSLSLSISLLSFKTEINKNGRELPLQVQLLPKMLKRGPFKYMQKTEFLRTLLTCDHTTKTFQ